MKDEVQLLDTEYGLAPVLREGHPYEPFPHDAPSCDCCPCGYPIWNCCWDCDF